MNVGFVSLGCSKNLVDTEMFIGMFKKENFNIVNETKDADIIIVNTCGFIESAKQEAINTILEMANYKENGNCKYLIATGCLVKRYKSELEKAIPEVDLYISVDEYDEMWSKIENLLNIEQKSKNTLEYIDRIVATGNTTAYLKIAEGCSNNCTYCAIPSIRGGFESRKFEDIIEEAKSLASKGYKEIIVIAQDTSKYGIDLYGKVRLAELLDDLCKIDGIEWIRFLYTYPENINNELIEVVKKNDKICNYFDIPLQHFSDKVLKRMNRKSNSESIKKVITKIRESIPNCIIRTTFIVGFPGETDEDFEKLYNFVKEAKFEKLGAFKYSKEDGTSASRLSEQIHHRTKQKRWNLIMKEQEKISKKLLEEKIGNIYEAIVDSVDGKYIIARSYMDIPDEDGVIYIENNGKVQQGSFIKCEITEVKGYDLIGKLVD